MRFSHGISPPRTLLTLVLICALGAPAQGQDRHDWQSVAQLKVGDRVRMSTRTEVVEGAFQNWTPEQVTVGTVSARRDDVLKIEKYRPGAWGRGKKAAVGAAIGFAGGFVMGAVAGEVCSQQRSTTGCSPAEGGVFLGMSFAIIGAGIGALLPSHTKDVIYSIK